MSIRKLGDTIILDFVTHNPTTGAVSDADVLPTCEVFEDDNDAAILSPAVTKRVAKTGDYRVPIAATAANGFEVGKSYNIIASATVAAVSAKARIAAFTLDGKRVNDLNDLAASDVWEVVIENAKKAKHLLSVVFAFAKGKASGATGKATTLAFRDDADALNRISMTVDANGNRTASSIDVSDIP